MDRIVLSKRATPAEAEVVVDGTITLVFRRIEGKVWKVGSYRFGRNPSTKVSRRDFLEARRLAVAAMQKAAAEPPKPAAGKGLTDREIAERILRAAAEAGTSVASAVGSFCRSATWLDESRLPAIWAEIGKIGGAASKRRARRARRERLKRAQLPLPL